MAQSTALGHMGLMFGLLGVILILTGVLQALSSQNEYQGPLAWALITWAIGLGFVMWERFESGRER
ncbi:MAG: hypothetical protein E6K06_01805 [Methanobacteriota archaeon]|nr:MAG: hypothetical protein E6K06_01805 [Euryarchaeota archaeon]